MKKEQVILVGTGQHARVVMYNIKAQNKYSIACFTTYDPNLVGQTYEGYKIAGTDDDIDRISKEYKTNKFFIAFGDIKKRKDIFEYYISKGLESVNIIHPNAVVADDVSMGTGVLIECGSLITPNPVIGNNVVINAGSQINHDNIVEDHVYIASGVILSGGVTIKENTLLDDGVIITKGMTVGRNSIVTAGSVVSRNIPDNVIACGNPAKSITNIDYMEKLRTDK